MRVVLVICWTSWNGRPWNPAGSSPLSPFFYKIHSGMVYVDKDKYLTPVKGLRQTRASHDSQYRRYQAYSDALKNSFFSRTIPQWNSLPSSVVSVQTTEEFKSLIN